MVLYRLIKLFIKLTLRLYFGKVTIEGIERIPRDAPLLITPNHQNAFLDPFLVGSLLPLKLHFFTRSDIFKWWNKWLFFWLGMIPIYRIRDGYQSLAKNNTTFDLATDLFKQGKSILIFPEGNHGEHYFLRPLTKGAARIALQSQQVVTDPIKIVPVGLNYFSHRTPRRRVLMVIGNPIDVTQYQKKFEQNEAKTLNELRSRITTEMKSTLIIPDNSEEYESQKESIFRSANRHLAFEELKALTPSEKDSEKASKHRLAWIFNPIPLLLIRIFLMQVDDVVFYSSFKYALGLIVFPLWWALSFGIIFLASGEIYIATIVTFTMIGSLFYSYYD